MRTVIITMLLCLYPVFGMQAQDSNQGNHRNFPLIISIEFHSLSLPFKNKRPLFANVGIGLGTEVSHNGNRNWVQQFKLTWYGNKTVGGGILLHTQAVWRPTLVSDTFSEVKLGVGYLHAKRPKVAYKPTEKGWEVNGKKGKGMFVLPIGIGAGYDTFDTDTYISPFVGYQFLLATKYNQDIPVVPFTLMEAGSRIHF